MIGREIAKVRWGSLNSRMSLYGSALATDPAGGIRLVNHLMPSGTTLQEWYSFTDYQSLREAPSLPLLHHGRAYRIEPVLESSPRDGVVFDVRYFDRFNTLIRTDVLYPPEYAFEYPAACHHYTVRLVNAGCDELSFTSFALWEVDGRGQE